MVSSFQLMVQALSELYIFTQIRDEYVGHHLVDLKHTAYRHYQFKTKISYFAFSLAVN